MVCLLWVTGLATDRNRLAVALLHDLVAAETALVRLLGVESCVKGGCALLAGLVVTAGGCTGLDIARTVPCVVTACTVNLGRVVFGVRKSDYCLGGLDAFRRTKL